MLKKTLCFLFIISTSCSSGLTKLTTTSNIEYLKLKNIETIAKKDIKVNISRKYFYTKQVGYSNAILPKTFKDIEYVKVFLVKEDNYTNPFEPGANIFGDGVYKIFTKENDFSDLIISNVPVGNTYKAVVGAFDINNLNITKENTDLSSLDKRWFLSSNSVNVANDSVIYSSGSSLMIDLYLEDGEGAKVGSYISIKESEIDEEDIKL